DTFMKSEILNRENRLRSGESLVMRYRTYPGLSPSIDVYNAKNEQVINKAAMIASSGDSGIYEYEVKFMQGWGKGDFTIVCSESSKGSLDAMVISVVRSDIDEIAGQVSAVLGSTSGFSEITKDLMGTNEMMNSKFGLLESAIGKISKVMASKSDENIAGSLDSVFTLLTNLSVQIKNMGGAKPVSLEKLYEVSFDKKNDMEYLKNKTQQLKAAMSLNQKSVDNMANKPITQTWYEYKK
ncbi:MAG: hypothetical protein V1919_02595, partial [Candidatus Omnitrophota bacterium]